MNSNLKKLACLYLLVLFVVSSVNAQIPQGFSFQSLVLDGAGMPVMSTVVGVKIEILDGSASGNLLYEETHDPMTNAQGIYTITIGFGNPVQGGFEQIDWLSGSKFLAVSHDISGGSNYTLVGSSQLLSVPYALASGTSYIKPRIYVSRSKHQPIPFVSTNPTAQTRYDYLYQWIDGVPETIFVDHIGFPDNMYIESNSELGYLFEDYIDNFSKVDTIFDGLKKRFNLFRAIDPSVGVPQGDYPVKLIFRTASDILDSVEFVMKVNQYTYDDCVSDIGGEKTVIHVSCDTLNVLMGTKSTISPFKYDTVLNDNILDSGEDCEIRNSNCVNWSTSCSYFSTHGISIDLGISFSTSGDTLSYDFKLRDYTTGELVSCKVDYN